MSVQGLLAIGLCCVLAVSLLHSAALFRLLTSKLRGVSLKRECGTTQTLSWQLPKTSKRIHTCDLCKDVNWLFILSSGRSGSTTAMDMVNAVPGFTIRGEAYGHLNHLRQAFEAVERSVSNSSDSASHAYSHGNVSSRSLLCDIQQWTLHSLGINRVLQPTEVVGFKDTKYDILVEENGRTGLVDFFKRAFPCARFVLNMRKDPKRQFKAQTSLVQEWRHEDILLRHSWSLSRLKAVNKGMIEWARSDPNATLLLFEDFSLAEFNSLLRWMGVADCRFSRMCHSNYFDKSKNLWGFDTDEGSVRLNGTCSFRGFEKRTTDLENKNFTR